MLPPALALVVCALLGVPGWGGSGGARADEEPCDPIDAPRVYAQLPPSQEGGVAPSNPSGSGGSGPIVNLPTPPGGARSQQLAGEALLSLPKRADGTIPEDFELAPGAQVAESYWSPVLCATVVRVVGAPGAAPHDLVTRVPESVAVVPHHVYATAASEVVAAEDSGDPYRSFQYALDRLGVEASRSISDGTGARVAVLDSSPQSDHRDLGASLRVATFEGGPTAAAAVHGTLITGVIAAVEGNAFGTAGVAPGAEIRAIPVCRPIGATASDDCALFDLLRGLDLAWEERAQILNLSLVGPANPLLERASDRLDSLGVLLVAAAGNTGTSEPRYPAAYPSVIGVGSIDRNGAFDPRSNRGLSAEILAPGVEVLSTVPGDAFAFGSGTSFAAAQVSGVLALLLGSGAPADAARTALFQAAHAAAGVPLVPETATVCETLLRLGPSCPGP